MINVLVMSESCRNSGGTGASTRRRVLAQKFCNELHELQPLKENTSCPQRLAVCLHVNQ
ncbi:unnamed protein product [Ceratitis capitata]|uniref:(Mediterranean fruit fly) hypothetical protein n=1 Tax=Ceratitis capitata TaxID=7213 RepID=A0A811UZ70_CERCA|nr:unnamed protein product [Ceratitis capitata]